MANPDNARRFSVATTACAAFVTAAFTIIACSSFAALIFVGPLDQFVGRGIWLGLFTALIVGVIVSLISSYPGVVAIPQDRVAPILALMAVSMVAKMDSASPQEKCLAVMAAIAVVSIITGSFLFLLGRMRLGNLIRYIRQAEQSESLYFVESGRVTARLEFQDGRTLRLRTMGPGTVVGEVGLFLRGMRTASVITEQPCTVYRLSMSSLEQMSRDNPDLALAFHRYLICLLGERLTNSTALLRGIIE